MSDLDKRLHELAGMAGTEGNLPTAGELRRTATRRQQRRLTAAPAAVLAVAGIVVFGTGVFDDPTERPVSQPAAQAPRTTAAPTTPPASGDGQGTTPALPSSDRMVVIAAPTNGSGKRLLTARSGTLVDASGKAAGERTRWVLAPLAPGSEQYLVKTTLLVGGEPECLVATEGMKLLVTSCDAADEEQHFMWGKRTGGVDILSRYGAVVVADRSVALTTDWGTVFTVTDAGPYSSPF